MEVLAPFLLASLGVCPAIPGSVQAERHVVALPEHGLTLTLPALDGFVDLGKNRWRGRLGSSWVEIAFQTLPSAKYDFDEPDDVLDIGPSFWRDTEHGRNEPGRRSALAGPFGFAGYAVLERSELRDKSGAPAGLRLLLGGLLPEAGYWITLEAKPAPEAAGETPLRAFLETGIAYAGAARDPAWSDEEARARWQRDAADVAQAKLAKPVRTAHYIVLTDAPSGEGFGKRMEECYATVRKTYPFDEVPGRRLLPVLLFRTRDEYVAFHARCAGLPAEMLQVPKGNVWRGAYVTWAEKPGDPVHLHEATHQLFAARLGLAGGGAWFQEGVAEYLASKSSERAAAAALVKRGAHVPLRTLVASASLAPASDPDVPATDGPGEAVRQAALWIEFLRESAWAKERFPSFLARVGKGGGGAVEIEAAVQSLYGVDLGGLEARFVEYCKKR